MPQGPEISAGGQKVPSEATGESSRLQAAVAGGTPHTARHQSGLKSALIRIGDGIHINVVILKGELDRIPDPKP